MRYSLLKSIKAMVLVSLGGFLAVTTMPAAAQSTPYRAPRTAGGRPDLNGIWQALDEANYDLEAHTARPTMALRGRPYGRPPAAGVLATRAGACGPPRPRGRAGRAR